MMSFILDNDLYHYMYSWDYHDSTTGGENWLEIIFENCKHNRLSWRWNKCFQESLYLNEEFFEIINNSDTYVHSSLCNKVSIR